VIVVIVRVDSRSRGRRMFVRSRDAIEMGVHRGGMIVI
jgi:hypothetical protein